MLTSKYVHPRKGCSLVLITWEEIFDKTEYWCFSFFSCCLVKTLTEAAEGRLGLYPLVVQGAVHRGWEATASRA